MEGIRYYLRTNGMSKERVKQFMFLVRTELLLKATFDLVTLTEARISGLQQLVSQSDKLDFHEAAPLAKELDLLQSALKSATNAGSHLGDLPSFGSLKGFAGELMNQSEEEAGEPPEIHGSQASEILSSSRLLSGVHELSLEESRKRLAEADVVGYYFSASWCPPCQTFTPRLASVYQKVNERNPGSFEVVFVSWDRNQVEFEEYYREKMAWLALPFTKAREKQQLQSLFSVVGIPSLFLFDKHGNALKRDANQLIFDDPDGSGFPWRNSLSINEVLRVLEGVSIESTFAAGQPSEQCLNPNGRVQRYAVSPVDLIVNEYIGFFFGAWNVRKCMGPLMSIPYLIEGLGSRGRPIKLRVIYVSCDRSLDQYKNSYNYVSIDFIPYAAETVRTKLRELMQATEAPAFVLFNPQGELMTSDGIKYLTEDTRGEQFPWGGRDSLFEVRRVLKIDPKPPPIEEEEKKEESKEEEKGEEEGEEKDAKDGEKEEKKEEEKKEDQKAEEEEKKEEKEKKEEEEKKEEKEKKEEEDKKEEEEEPTLGYALKNRLWEPVDFDVETDRCVTALYFSAHWCGPCREFTPTLVDLYNTLNSESKKFEVIFVSLDKNEASYKEYAEKMPWLRAHFDNTRIQDLIERFEVRGIPTLVLFNADKKLITVKGVEAVRADPKGAQFPWLSGIPKNTIPSSSKEPLMDLPLTILTTQDNDLISFGLKQFGYAAVKEYHAKRMSPKTLSLIQNFIVSVQSLTSALPSPPPPGGLPPATPDCRWMALETHRHTELLPLGGQDIYAGGIDEPKKVAGNDFLSLPVFVGSLSDVLQSLTICEELTESLLERAVKATTTGRVALQMQIIGLIDYLFTSLIPIPAPLLCDESISKNCLYVKGDLTKADQLKAMRLVHRLMMKYATVWQIIERPDRALDSGRSVTSLCILSIFSWFAHYLAPASVEEEGKDDSQPGLAISRLLTSNGGYSLAFTVCLDNRPIENIAETMELVSPHVNIARAAALNYLVSTREAYAKIFGELHQPMDKVHLDKHSPTVEFFRELLGIWGYEWVPREAKKPPEIVSLCKWMFDDGKLPITEEHPEWSWLFDTIAVSKFLATMETIESEVLRRKLAETHRSWTLSFEDRDGGVGHSWTTSVRRLYWELTNVFGSDQNIAEVSIFAFGYREIHFGEGPVVHSPARPTTYVQEHDASEDDILHCQKLPSFGEVISREELEVLLSYLTVNYVRIPLVVSFFSKHDRMMYLYNRQLQVLFRSAIFEAGGWSPHDPRKPAPPLGFVPIRQTAQAKQQAQQIMKTSPHPDAIPEELRFVDDRNVLGSHYGLVLNELHYAPAATIEPLLIILNAVHELPKASVYSEDAAFILYLVLIAIDFESYLVFAIEEEKNEKHRVQEALEKGEKVEWNRGLGSEKNLVELERFQKELSSFLHGHVRSLLSRWLKETQLTDDFRTQSVLHAYIALLWQNVHEKDLTPEIFQDLLGSLSFVRNWHGFGLGQNRSHILNSKSTNLSSQDRLLRFLQAHGVDTSRLEPNSLDQWITDTGRPLFLHIGKQTIRAPTIIREKEETPDIEVASEEEGQSNPKKSKCIDENLPPADLPESRIFSMMQRKRRLLVDWVSKLPQEEVDNVMLAIVKVALRAPSFQASGKWEQISRGVFLLDEENIQIDIQSPEVLWRQDELRPVPDSMVRFADYETLFGVTTMHCGVRAAQKERLWVELVGTNCSLQEWTPWNPVDTGIGCPRVPIRFTFSQEDNPCPECKQFGKCYTCPHCFNIACHDAPLSSIPLSQLSCKSCSQPPVIPRQLGKMDDCVFQGVRYCRPLDPSPKNPHDVPSEMWVADLLQPILSSIYGCGNPMKWRLLFSETPLQQESTFCRMIGCDPKKGSFQWKECLIFKERGLVLLFNLLSYGRKVYRSLIFSNLGDFSFHCLQPYASDKKKFSCSGFPPEMVYATGDFEKVGALGSTLVINRENTELGGRETYLPPRLVQGVIPGVLLESFTLWQGEDNVVRGTPFDSHSQWQNFKLEIELKDSKESGSPCTIIRRPLQSSFTSIKRSEETDTSDHIEILLALGFEKQQVKAALRGSSTIGIALNSLLLAKSQPPGKEESKVSESEGEEESKQTPIRAETDTFDDQVVRIEQEGFSVFTARYALTKFGNEKLALGWLTDGNSLEEVEALDQMYRSLLLPESEQLSGSIKSSLRASSHVENTLIRDGDLVLLDLLHSSGPLFSLTTLLSRLDDIGHILIWGSPISGFNPLSSSAEMLVQSQSDIWCSVSIIELPRLKIRFQPKKDIDGVTRLYSLDHDGWFISTTYNNELQNLPEWGTGKADSNLPAGSELLHNLLHGIDRCIVLQNAASELQVLLVNHDLYRPKMKGNAFSLAIVSDRASGGWQSVMDRRYYLYPVHTSMTFLLTPSLASTLYLAFVRMMSRNYKAAFSLFESCYVDTSFTAEEKWILNQFRRTKKDRFPDAIANRLKLSLAVMRSDYNAPWKIHKEFDSYLKKIQHVSSDCTLTVEEELDLIHRCPSGSARVRNRRAVLLESMKEVFEPVEQVGEFVRYGGEIWHKLGKHFRDSMGKEVQVFRYIRPHVGVDKPGMNDVQISQLLWDNDIFTDEDSGTNRQLGFFFMYEVLTGTCPLTLMGRDVSKSLGTLLVRAFHLKQCRWGKDAASTEAEYTPSEPMKWLYSVLTFPDYPWPLADIDEKGMKFLATGFDIYSGNSLKTNAKQFLESLKLSKNVIFAEEMYEILFQVQNETCDSIRAMPLHQGGPVFAEEEAQQRKVKFRPKPRNSACNTRSVSVDVTQSPEDLQYFASVPLEAIGLQKFVTWKKGVERARCQIEGKHLPFDVSSHPSARSTVARDILDRLEGDARGFASMLEGSNVPFISSLGPEDFELLQNESFSDQKENLAHAISTIDAVEEHLSQIAESLQKLHHRDSRFVDRTILQILDLCNEIPDLDRGHEGPTEDTAELICFFLHRLKNLRSSVTIELVIGEHLSSTGEEELLILNPYIKEPSKVTRLVSSMLLHTSRVHHANACVAMTRSLTLLLSSLKNKLEFQKRAVQQGQSESLQFSISLSSSDSDLKSSGSHSSSILTSLQKIQHSSSSLAKLITSKRHYGSYSAGEATFSYDPRFLVFEFIFDILLRGRQVEMVNQFVADCTSGVSRVQQMIMGAGKTTVVGPLLALILADGKSLVTQVMPTALLEQTRQVMRSRFSRIVVKRVYTLEFDRSVKDGIEFVAEVYSKLNAAREGAAVVCSSSEAIKSVMLKFVELLHSLEQDAESVLAGNAKVIDRVLLSKKQVQLMQTEMLNRSDMADKLVRILDIWANGILIMDEVDVLLHPLRSELNFPIGIKKPIDMAGHRWNLPIHLIDGIFAAQSLLKESHSGTKDPHAKAKASLRSSGLGHSEEGPGAEILQGLADGIEEGFELRAFQKNPHLVLLDDAYYQKKIAPFVAQWALLWLHRNWENKKMDLSDDLLLRYLMCGGAKLNEVDTMQIGSLLSENMKLLNLAATWVCTLIPHVLSKINRVTYGILTKEDLELVDVDKSPPSRLHLAVPFVGKDVPSRTSEFAHPDAVIGLSILAYRYDGLRLSDLHTTMTILKRDFTHQVGPREQRPASVVFDQWRSLGEHHQSHAILPLSLFQPSDPKQMKALHMAISRLPDTIYHHLRLHVFPSCLNFQEIKISACGHELGSSILFKNRIGFSGTPSNLLPIDLGTCQYEPGSDGRVVHVLSNPEVTTASIKDNWTAQSLLEDIATANPPFHALIDTGALMTGLSNFDVSRYLLRHLPDAFEGVVYLDRWDRQKLLLRTGRSVYLNQSGVNPERRFTFYDQVHTTGMDIKQCPSARACVTIGKDMTFRDYAQGCYRFFFCFFFAFSFIYLFLFRMRGIGLGQTIHLFIIPEVLHKIESELALCGMETSNQFEITVPAWLLINSMKMESAQFVQLRTQELQNIWRKEALSVLLADVHKGTEEKQGTYTRLRRFIGEEKVWLRRCLQQFREPITFDVEAKIPKKISFFEKMNTLVAENNDLVNGSSRPEVAQKLIDDVMREIQQISDQEAEAAGNQGKLGLQIEQEQEQEQEILVEEEKEQVPRFNRDDEAPNRWSSKLLRELPTPNIYHSFYPFNQLAICKGVPKLHFPERLLLSDNFFRLAWIGLGDRRLKNVSLVLEWVADLQEGSPRYVVAISLAEGETIRKMIHSASDFCQGVGIALRTIHGDIVIDRTPSFVPDEGKLVPGEDMMKQPIALSLLCLRFFNCDMFYSDVELDALEQTFAANSFEERTQFFTSCLRLRMLSRNSFQETPVARLFMTDEGMAKARLSSKFSLFANKLKNVWVESRVSDGPGFDPLGEFRELAGGDGDMLSCDQMKSLLEKWASSYSIEFEKDDLKDTLRLLDLEGKGFVSFSDFEKALDLNPGMLEDTLSKRKNQEEVFQLLMQGFVTMDQLAPDFFKDPPGFKFPPEFPILDLPPVVPSFPQEIGLDGEMDMMGGFEGFALKENEWQCQMCTTVNDKKLFFCDACQLARPSLSDVLF